MHRAHSRFARPPRAARLALIVGLGVVAACGTERDGRVKSGQTVDGAAAVPPAPRGEVPPEAADPSADAGDPGLDAGTSDVADATTSDSSSDAGEGGTGQADAAGSPVVESFCGNARVDPGEECDPGSDYAPEPCSYGCQARDFVAGGDPPASADSGASSRAIGAAHPLAVAADGSFAAATLARSGAVTQVLVDAYDAAGFSRAASRVIASTGVEAASGASVVALSAGRYAVVWSSLAVDGDELGVAMTLYDPRGGVSATRPANAASVGSQHDADAVLAGGEVVVAWVDESDPATAPDLRIRTFDDALMPASGETALAATSDRESGVRLAPFGTTYAAAWRSGTSAGESLHVRAGTAEWTIALAAPGPAGDRPALVELDAARLLVVYSEGPPPGGDGNARLRAAIIETTRAGALAPFDVSPGLEGDAPSLARSGADIYLAWHSAGRVGDPLGEDVFVKRVPVASTLDWTVAAVPLPRWDEHRAGDQRYPAVAGSSGGGLIGAWEDLGGSVQKGSHGSVIVHRTATPGGRTDDLAGAADAHRFAPRLQALFCRHLADCCGVPAQFDYVDCQAGSTSAAVTSGASRLDGGRVGVSRRGIDACVRANLGVTCAKFDADSLHAIDRECGGAVLGKVPVGATGCDDDVECARGAYCAPPDPSGARTCAPVKLDGETCDVPTACTPLGPPYEYCAGTLCARAKGLGEACQTYSECASGICDGQTSVCLDSSPLADPGVPGGFCDAFTLRDAGTD